MLPEGIAAVGRVHVHQSAKRPVPRQGWARLVLVLVVVAGLVGMHGMGESAVLGCPASTSDAPGAHPGPAVQAPVIQHGAQRVKHAPPSALNHGSVCQPLLPDWLAWLPVLACVALLPFASLLSLDTILRQPRTRLRSWWRAPPRAGRVCLVRVCVSRP